MALIKTSLKDKIYQRDWEGIIALWDEKPNIQRVVVSILFDSDPLIQWKTIQAMGHIAHWEYKKSPERVRNIIRRLLWGMNDESGNIIWRAPETISEILVKLPELIPEYGAIVASHIDLEPFPPGVHFAVARLSKIDNTFFKYTANFLANSLKNPDPTIRIFAAIALMNMDENTIESYQSILMNDHQHTVIYNFTSGKMMDISVAYAVNNMNTDNFIAGILGT